MKTITINQYLKDAKTYNVDIIATEDKEVQIYSFGSVECLKDDLKHQEMKASAYDKLIELINTGYEIKDIQNLKVGKHE